MRWRRPGKWDPLPAEFAGLTTYNSEVARGLVHTPEWAARMARLQVEYEAWQREQWQKQGFGVEELPGGGLVLFMERRP